jgi:GDP-L-fucose synthase
MSTVVVTGANGLAGSAACAHLASQGYEVIPVTRKDGDLRDGEQCYDAFRKNHSSVDFVFHAAATVYGIAGNMQNQGKSIYDNTLINTNVIETCRLLGVKKIVAMGTNAIYPWPPVLPYDTADIFEGRPHDMEAAYGHAKRHMLAMLEAYGIDFAYLVSGNLYGPRDTFNTETGHVLPSLVKKFYDATLYEAGPGVSVWGDGTATRDFLYSGDLARIVQMAIEKPEFAGPVNIGSGQTASIQYVCKRLSSVSGVDYGRVHYDTSKPTGRPDCYADLSALTSLGFKRNWRLAEGLKETYDWYATKRQGSPAA